MRAWSSKEVAEKLGISVQRVRALAGASRLDAHKVGDRWLVESLPRHDLGSRAGRPLASGSAWALLAELCGTVPGWIHAAALSRLRRRLRDPHWLVRALVHGQPRSKVLAWRALPADLPRIRREAGIVLTGLSAVSAGLDIVPERAGIDAYVDAKTLGFMEKRYRPGKSSEESNLTLRIPTHPWVLSFAEAPLAVAAADLLASPDPRRARAAREALEKLSRG